MEENGTGLRELLHTAAAKAEAGWQGVVAAQGAIDNAARAVEGDELEYVPTWVETAHSQITEAEGELNFAREALEQVQLHLENDL